MKFRTIALMLSLIWVTVTLRDGSWITAELSSLSKKQVTVQVPILDSTAKFKFPLENIRTVEFLDGEHVFSFGTN